MSQRIVHSTILLFVLGIFLGGAGCSKDHRKEGEKIAIRLSEELIEQQMHKKTDSIKKTENTRAEEIQAELRSAELTADELRLMLDSLQQHLTVAQQKAPLEKKEPENKENGKPISTSH